MAWLIMKLSYSKQLGNWFIMITQRCSCFELEGSLESYRDLDRAWRWRGLMEVVIGVGFLRVS